VRSRVAAASSGSLHRRRGRTTPHRTPTLLLCCTSSPTTSRSAQGTRSLLQASSARKPWPCFLRPWAQTSGERDVQGLRVHPHRRRPALTARSRPRSRCPAVAAPGDSRARRHDQRSTVSSNRPATPRPRAAEGTARERPLLGQHTDVRRAAGACHPPLIPGHPARMTPHCPVVESDPARSPELAEVVGGKFIIDRGSTQL